MSAALETMSLSVSYGGVKAVIDVDLQVGDGELVGLIGPNGAGKTTLLDAIGGFTRSTGTVRLGGQDLSGLEPHERSRRGLARTWQAGELFEDLSVRENLSVAACRPSPWQTVGELLAGRRPPAVGVEEALDLFGLAGVAAAQPDELSQGQRKLVGVARAVVARPRVVLLDEPAAGLDTEESRVFGAHLRSLLGHGTAMLLIDHDLGLVLSVCDRVVAIEFGRVIASGTPEEVRRDPAVIKAYLGEAELSNV